MLGTAGVAGAQPAGVTELEEIVVSGGRGGGDNPDAIAAELRDKPAGQSIVTQRDMEKRPVRDVSEILRTEPGIVLTGGGQNSNKRQIDIRGMGPEYTLILIDGKRVSARDSARYSWGGSRNTRGDTNWVPADVIERIEVIRGPAAARYGSGAMGGVVNIITKKASSRLTGGITGMFEQPENPKEGWVRKTDGYLSGPISDAVRFRMYGSLSKRRQDSADINGPVRQGTTVDDFWGAAGREGVSAGDINGLVTFDLTPTQTLDIEAGYSRQLGLYAGESWSGGRIIAENGAVWSRLDRVTASATHRGDWGFGKSRLTAAFEGTNNQRRTEGLAGGGEGQINSTAWQQPSLLRNYLLDGELVVPLETYWKQTITLGLDARRETLYDANSIGTQTNPPQPKNPFMAADYAGVFAYDEIAILDNLIVTPGVRFDHTTYGDHVGPSANAVWHATPWLSFKGGIARAFKAPNVFQTNPSYVYTSRGSGCAGNGPCYILGNPDLRPETAVNKELGFNVDLKPVRFGLTYFHNDFKDKITTSRSAIGRLGANFLMEWVNARRARVSGLEGRFRWDIAEPVSVDVNFTRIFESKDLDTGETLSSTPAYTINATLELRPSDVVSLYLNAQAFGEQTTYNLPSSNASRVPIQGSVVDPYTLFNVSAVYQLNDSTKLRAGINNIADRQVLRQTTNPANGGQNVSFNESGRTFWAAVAFTF